MATIDQKEMDRFLVEIGGLINARFPERPAIVNSNFFEVGEGWLPLIKELIEDLIRLGWDRKVYQVKEKWGGLRFYIGSATNPIHERIERAEQDSYKTCEVTGEPGEVRTDIGWVRVLSEVEYSKIKKK